MNCIESIVNRTTDSKSDGYFQLNFRPSRLLPSILYLKNTRVSVLPEVEESLQTITYEISRVV